MQLLFRLWPGVFDPWNARCVDLLFQWRNTSESLRPHYDDTVVHVDLNLTSMQQVEGFYLDRTHFARSIRNLANMNIAAQVYDFIFAARTDSMADRSLIEAARSAGNVYVGMALELSENSGDPIPRTLQEGVSWDVAAEDYGHLPRGTRSLDTFPDLASAAGGMAHLNTVTDADGVYRRMPLLIRYGDVFVPSLALRVVADFLRVTPDRIRIEPGDAITLREAHRPGGSVGDVVIPIDDQGNMIINFVGRWERMTHYNFASVLKASEDRDELELWRDELTGKIAVVSEVAIGSADVGPVPTDLHFPLSGLHANAIHTILTEQFLSELSSGWMLIVEVLVLGLIAGLAVRCAPLPFAAGSVVVVVAYSILFAVSFFYAQTILQLMRPLLTAGLEVVVVLAYRYVDELEEQVRDRTEELRQTHAQLADAQEQLITELEKELQTAHDMQMGLMPKSSPQVEGIELGGRCVPWAHVGGDFFQYYQKDGGVGIVLADVTGHGMEAAVPAMAFSGILKSHLEAGGPVEDLFQRLNRTLVEVLEKRTFICCAIAEFDLTTRTIKVCNAGCPYPIHYMAKTDSVQELQLDAYPLGIKEESSYASLEVRYEAGDRLVLCSDGIVEAIDATEEASGFERLAEVVRMGSSENLNAEALHERVIGEVTGYAGQESQEDDQTVVVASVDTKSTI